MHEVQEELLVLFCSRGRETDPAAVGRDLSGEHGGLSNDDHPSAPDPTISRAYPVRLLPQRAWIAGGRMD
jgi:hypothetical protein